ncbi:MAG: hypothetical protein QM656_11180 [Paracoccaceae bacterium]
MKRTNTTRTAIAMGATVFLAIAVPAGAALWPAAPQKTVDLARFDAITRIGAEALPTDPYCDTVDMIDVSLSEDFAERITLSALNPDSTRLDFWSSDLMGTWTVTYTRADGVMCVVGSGTGWRAGDAPARFMEQAGVAL